MKLNLEKLEEIMKAGRWNTFNLSVAAGIPQGTIWRTVKGRTMPNTGTIAKICQTLEITVDEILIADDTKRAA